MKIRIKLGGRNLTTFAVSSKDNNDQYADLTQEPMTRETRLRLLQEMAIETFKEGFRAAGGGKYIDVDKDVVIENGKIVIKNIPEPDFKSVGISTNGLTLYEIGRLTAQNVIRGLDSDEKIKNFKIYKNTSWDDQRIRDWVIHKKLPQNPVEWQSVNRLRGDDYDRRINEIVNSIIFAPDSGIYAKNFARSLDK